MMKVSVVIFPLLSFAILSVIFGLTLNYGLSRIDYAERWSHTIPHDYFFWKNNTTKVEWFFYLTSFTTIIFFFLFIYLRVKSKEWQGLG